MVTSLWSVRRLSGSAVILSNTYWEYSALYASFSQTLDSVYSLHSPKLNCVHGLLVGHIFILSEHVFHVRGKAQKSGLFSDAGPWCILSQKISRNWEDTSKLKHQNKSRDCSVINVQQDATWVLPQYAIFKCQLIRTWYFCMTLTKRLIADAFFYSLPTCRPAASLWWCL